MSYKLQYDGNKYFLTVPANQVDARDWEKGDLFDWKINDNGNLELQKVSED